MDGLTTSSDPRMGLLRWRMALLKLDPDELRGADPLLFRELQGRCSLCQSPDRCGAELARAAWQDWREYCRNETILTMLSAQVSGCLDAISD